MLLYSKLDRYGQVFASKGVVVVGSDDGFVWCRSVCPHRMHREFSGSGVAVVYFTIP